MMTMTTMGARLRPMTWNAKMIRNASWPALVRSSRCTDARVFPPLIYPLLLRPLLLTRVPARSNPRVLPLAAYFTLHGCACPQNCSFQMFSFLFPERRFVSIALFYHAFLFGSFRFIHLKYPNPNYSFIFSKVSFLENVIDVTDSQSFSRFIKPCFTASTSFSLFTMHLLERLSCFMFYRCPTRWHVLTHDSMSSQSIFMLTASSRFSWSN